MSNNASTFAAGQSWRYNAPKGFEESRILIGAIASFSAEQRVFCCSVTQAHERQPDGSFATISIPFLAMTEEALRATVTTCDDTVAATLPADFADALSAWRDDPRGLSYFTVPFDGYMDRMIARQMAAIIGSDTA